MYCIASEGSKVNFWMEEWHNLGSITYKTHTKIQINKI